MRELPRDAAPPLEKMVELLVTGGDRGRVAADLGLEAFALDLERTSDRVQY